MNDPPASDVLRVVDEINDILTAVRLLIRTCERCKLHRETHALEICLELMLRRRNYILNVSFVTNENYGYDSFPCDNCSITYPTVFLIYCLDRMLANSDGSCDYSSLCRRSCSIVFDTPPQIGHIMEGVLYPMGEPYVAGPSYSAPATAAAVHTTPYRLLDECDETKSVFETFRYVASRFGVANTNDGGSTSCFSTTAVTTLAECLTNLLAARRNFGFDMDCIYDADVERCRTLLSVALHSYNDNVLGETVERAIGLSRKGNTQSTTE